MPETSMPETDIQNESQFQLNGENQALKGRMSIRDLCDKLGMGDRGFAVECNGEIIPRSRHKTVFVQSGDCIEIVHMVGGG